MKLTITPEANEMLKEINSQDRSYLLLWYDVDDCGCGVNGMPTIRLTDEKSDYHQDVLNDSFPTIISKQQAVFFNQDIKLDIINGTFRLSSPDEMLNPFIPQQSIL
ncbi:iron-sulfur cluster biosynthesis family protein [Oceanobacillus halophilus]|uniref:Iron-sulfur cluster biosynthesis family protein n=1 Tax=Oceanobacillus halophilus TaxID=930130 RepID=A0A495ACN3_9BACI|nr:iron-sulfur cluster biosynthesis family protein [Oceanobacillus halophilus]RKQ37726.1 iron-sulfur cluster biosynthesis family protein [Oceanobacillus halophilus]